VRAKVNILVQNVLGLKGQVTFKVLLANWWSLALRGIIQVPRRIGEVNK